MIRFALSFLLGIACLILFHDISSPVWRYLFIACSVCLLILCFRPAWRQNSPVAVLAYLAGLSLAGWHATDYLDHRLDESLAGKDILLSGVVTGLPKSEKHVTRFNFELDESSQYYSDKYFPQKLKLSWYYGSRIQPGDRWQLLLRLKPPHGFMNPGGFDYEGWLYQHGIHATGYVRKSELNRKLEQNASHAFVSDGFIQRTRVTINRHIASSLSEEADGLVGIIQALATGSRDNITKDQWNTLVATGTNHLMAISGLHIGLAALFAYTAFFFLCKRLVPVAVLKKIPAQHLATMMALISASSYAVLAGMSIPTQRALLMLLTFSVASLLRRNSHPMNSLALAMIIVLLLHPASVLSAGFWFSFLAVAVIIAAYQQGLGERPWWQQLIVLQITLSVALSPVSAGVFQQVSLVSPLANLFMVPFVSFLVVPVVLLAMLLSPVTQELSAVLLRCAHWLLEAAWTVLEGLSASTNSLFILNVPPLWLLLIFVGIICLIFPGLLASLMRDRVRVLSPMAIRALCLPCFMPLLLDFNAGIKHGDYLLDVLDVGQGTAVVVRTRSHTLVYDTGAALGAKLDAGASVVVPFLRNAGIRQLDKLIISHGDNDHIGGARSILKAYPDSEVLGQQLDKIGSITSTPCRSGERWHWDGVDFEFLHPVQAVPRFKKSNNFSCVLRIAAAGGVTLLTGDIEARIEKSLLEKSALLDADILLVPHHGSRTSSTKKFVSAITPHFAVITAGHRNRYRLPSTKVIRRYESAGSAVLISGRSGTISFEIDAENGVSQPVRYRQQHARYWHHVLNPAVRSLSDGVKTTYGRPLKSSKMSLSQALQQPGPISKNNSE